MSMYFKKLLSFTIVALLISCSSHSVGTSSDVDVELADLKGIVVYENNSPANYAEITLYDINDTIPIDTSYSDLHGVYHFDSVNTGEYRIIAKANDSATAIMHNLKIDTIQETEVNLDTLWLTRPGVIVGSVLQYDGNGVVLVYIPGTSFISTIDSLGDFEMTGVAPDSNYTVIFERYGFSKVSISNVTVKPGDTTFLEPQALTPNMYPLNVIATYDTSENTVKIIWDKMLRSDIDGYIVSRKNANESITIPKAIHKELIKDTFYIDTLHDTLFSQSDSIQLKYQIQGQTIDFGNRTGYSLPATIDAFIKRDSSDYKSISLLQPKENDTLIGLQQYQIKWNYTGKIDSVKVMLTLDNGQSWNPISGIIKNRGVYDWQQIENAQSKKCQIKVVSSSNNSVIGISEQFGINLIPVDNMLLNGDFENGFKSWIPNIHSYDTTVEANLVIDSGMVHATVNACNESWKVSLYQYPNTPIYSFYKYEIVFKARATKVWKFYATVHSASGPYVQYSGIITSIDTEWKEYRFPLIMTGDPSGNNTVLAFAFGEEVGEVWLDDINLNIIGIN